MKARISELNFLFMIVIEVHLQGPQVIIVESAAEFDADPFLHVPITSPRQLQGFETFSRPLSILHSQFEQLELHRGEDLGSDTVEVKDEIHHPWVLGQLAGIGLRENLVLDEALDEDMGRSAFGNGAVILCQSINIIQEVGEFVFEGNGFLEGGVIDIDT